MWDLPDAAELLISEPLGPSLPTADTEPGAPGAEAQPPLLTPELWGYDAQVEARHVDLGTNVTMYGASGPKDTLIFLNQIKASTPFVAHNGSNADLVFDENGYVAKKPEGVRVKAEILRRSDDLMEMDPFTGDFRLYGQGTGLISVGDGFEANLVGRVHTADLPTEIIDGVTYWYADLTYSGEHDGKDRSKAARLFVIDFVEGDHIRDLALIHHSHLDEHRAGAVYAPEFLADMEPYTTLRFMDWMYANNLNLASDDSALDPEQRYVGVDHFTYNNIAGGSSLKFPSSVPIEHIVELANLVSADVWIPLPADITDARARLLAQYVADTLDADLEVYWEYGNEIWNGALGFDSFFYAQHMAAATFEGFTGKGTHAAVEWAAYRGPQLYDIIAEIFADAGREARYVSSSWAHSPPIEAEGGIDWNSYNVSYFEAKWAQSMPDAPSRPGDIVTDYAVGMYHSGVQVAGEGALGPYLVEAYADPAVQAEALARWMLFGNDPATFHDLDRDALDAPPVVAYHEGINIAVSRLVFDDVAAGLDPLRDLDSVIRLVGTELQYRGIHAADWTTVLIFEAAPPKDLAGLMADVELIGESFRRQGETNVGIKGSLLSNGDFRLDRHVAFVEHLGLNFVAYEGGTHLYAPRGDAMAAMFETYDKTWASLVQDAWFDRLDAAGVDLFLNYMSHDRTLGGNDYWGAQDHVGQPLEETSKGAHLIATITAGKPATAPDPDPVAASGAPVLDPGLKWNRPANWVVAEDGTLTETGARNAPITGTMARPETGTDALVLAFDVATTTDDPGQLRVVVYAKGPDTLQVADWEGSISDGQRVEIALDAIPEDHRDLEFVVRRIYNKTGEVEISGFELLTPVVLSEPVAQDETPSGTPGLLAGTTPEMWTAGDNWQIDADGTLVETAGTNAPVSVELQLEAMARSGLVLSLTVAAEAANPGKLRVVVQSFGAGAQTIASLDAKVVDGTRISLALDDIPDDHDQLRVIIRRVGNQHGDLAISDLVLEQPAVPEGSDAEPADASVQSPAPATIVEGPDDTGHAPGPVAAPTEEGAGKGAVDPAPDALAALLAQDRLELVDVTDPAWTGARTLLPEPGDGPSQQDWRLAAGWSFDGLGGITEHSATNAVLSADLALAAGESGSARSLVFDLAATDSAPGKLRVFVQAFGNGVTTLPGFEQTVRDGDRIEIDLGTLPAEHDSLRVVIRRVGTQQGAMTLSNLALVPTFSRDPFSAPPV